MVVMSLTVFVVLLAVAVSADFPPCTVEQPDCPSGLVCDPVAGRCFHEPRQLGEACGKEPSSRRCAKLDANTSHPLECSTWCGVCVLADQSGRREAAVRAEKERRAQHVRALHHVASRCGVQSNVTYMNFEETIASNMPVVYPRDDAGVMEVLSTIAKNGCKARPVGATHSSSSVITADWENNTVGISLAEYTPSDKAWAMVLNETDGTVKVPAGRSLFQLYQAIRPHGYFLPTQTAGPIFTMGGIVTNTVHGGVFNAGFVSEYVVGLRVATWTGTEVVIRVVTEEAELRHWRNSFGLLGLVTAVHFRLDRRNAFQVTTQRHKFSPFTREAVDKYFADLEEEFIYGESFFNPYAYEVNTVLFRKGAEVPKECRQVTDKECKWDYPKARCADETCCHYSYKFGDLNLDQSCRTLYTPQKSVGELQTAYSGLESAMKDIPYFGAPDLPTGQDAELCIFEWAMTEKLGSGLEDVLAYAFYDSTYIQVNSEVQQNALDVNDGFYLRAVPHAIKLMAYFVPREKLFDMLSIIREVYDEVGKMSGLKQLGNAEFRFLNITDKFTLLPTGGVSGEPKTGQYVNCEMVFNNIPNSDDRWWATALYKYEQRMQELDGFLHAGKSFCYGPDEHGEIQPYQNKTCMKRVFNHRQKTAFNAYRTTSDPAKLFDAGASIEFF